MNLKSKFLLIIFSSIGLLFALSVLAHNPRIVSGTGVVVVQNPEISQAFYGQLSGMPQWFEINSDKDFLLYINILLPKIPETKKDISVEIFRGDNWLLRWLDSDNTKWKEFYEPFGGDYYWQGAEYRETLEPGIYKIKVYSKSNQGKYSLAVGSQELFPFKEIIKTIILLPILKKDFFGKSPLSAFFNYTGLFLIGAVLIIGAIVVVVVWLVKKLRKKKAPVTF